MSTKKLGNLEFIVSSVDKKFSFTKDGKPKHGQKIFVKNNPGGYRYLIFWNHEENYDQLFKKDDIVITDGMVEGEYNNQSCLNGYQNASVELLPDSDALYKKGEVVTDIDYREETEKKLIKDNITPKADYPVKIYRVSVKRSKNYNSVEFGVEFSGTLDEALKEFDILKEVALRKLNEIL